MKLTERVTESARWFSDPSARVRHFSEFYHPQAVFHGYVRGSSLDLAQACNFYSTLWEAFPDFRVRILRAVEEPGMVAFHYSWEGTHKGAYAGFAPSNHQVHIVGMSFVRFEAQQVIERWNVSDSGVLVTQLRG
jgi:predicted ester cyclase